MQLSATKINSWGNYAGTHRRRCRNYRSKSGWDLPDSHFRALRLVTLLDGFDAQSIAFTASAMAKDLQVPVNAFGPIFGAGTIGLALGALALPPLADRYGRRYQIIVATLIFGVFSFATAWVDSFAALATLRFLAGIGIGAAVPNVVPLVSEFAPRRIRAALITAVTVSWPLGAVLGGLISAKLIPAFGWPSVFYAGGAAPILLALALLPTLPESVRFMATKDNPKKNIAKILMRIAPDPKTLEEQGAAEAGSVASREIWRVARSIFVCEDSKTAKAYGGGDPHSPYRFYMRQLLTKLGKYKRLAAFKSHPDMRDDEVTLDYVLDNIVIRGSVNEVVERILAMHEQIGDFGTLLYCGKDWTDVGLGRKSMELMAEKVMPTIDRAIGRSATAKASAH
jgi:hypothetical protein